MAKARRLPVRGDLVHKRKTRENGRGVRTVCGRYGYYAHLWRSVNCDVCLTRRKR